ncbi:16S rRNA (cytosine(967)-C(5))-methyltransferase RsmB [Kiritimatiellota bacterium B12222]|nr:16S rRNA (cytosine(967)-C(5))-methyltransferase RsmB [Kiritimatiellota bacterium B12222]
MTTAPSTNIPERDQAAELLKNWLLKGSLPYESGEWNFCSGLTREMVWSCLRHNGALDAWIEHLSKRPPSPALIPFLWIGLCQLLLLDGIPDHAAVHETLEAAKRAGIPAPQIGFINAVFRRTLREKEELLKWLDNQANHIRYSHPQVIVERWNKSFGKKQTEKILQWNQERSHTYARLTRKGTELDSLMDCPPDTVSYEFSEKIDDVPVFYQLPRGFSPTDLPDFVEGAWYIQDPSTYMAPTLLNVKAGERVLDACAAPGGKTLILAESMGEQTDQLLACDPNPKRCKRLQENLDRLGFEEVEVKTTDLHGLRSEQPFDAILLDVPCSNTGVYQRRPDAKWNFRKRMLTELIQLQYDILNQAFALLKPGGRLVYSTCSIEPEETTQQIQNWLSQNQNARLETESLLFPGEKKCDGAFAALIYKTS